jgi:uncharacterized protein YbgA (DUF1722 family)
MNDQERRIKQLEAQLEFYKSGTMPMSRRVQALVDHLLELKDDYLIEALFNVIDEVLTSKENTDWKSIEDTWESRLPFIRR